MAGSIETAGYGERLLCAVFAFEDRSGAGGRPAGAPVYFIYNYKRGDWYPFVPDGSGSEQRSTERELQLKAQMQNELPIEPEIERWFPLWGIPISQPGAGQSGIRPSPVKSVAASEKVTSAGGRITSEDSMSSAATRSPLSRTNCSSVAKASRKPSSAPDSTIPTTFSSSWLS